MGSGGSFGVSFFSDQTGHFPGAKRRFVFFFHRFFFVAFGKD